VSLVEKEPILRGKLIHTQKHAVVDGIEASESFANLRKNSEALTVARARSEGIALEIPGETYASRDYDVGVLA
jgi:hypothetical protein